MSAVHELLGSSFLLSLFSSMTEIFFSIFAFLSLFVPVAVFFFHFRDLTVGPEGK